MPNDVDELIATLNHPLEAEIQTLRAIILAVDPEVSEGIKWKAPSFFCKDWFATVNLRSTDRLQIILHTGAKVKAAAVNGIPVEDPEGMLKWLAKDRAMLTLADLQEIETKRPALTNLFRQWIAQMK